MEYRDQDRMNYATGDEISPHSRPTILVCSADLEDAELLAESLERRNFSVTIVSDAQQCLARIHQKNDHGRGFSIVFLSLDVPSGLDGFSTARLLRQNAYWGSIVVYSQHYLGRYEWESEEAGCDAFIIRDELDAQIDSLVALVGPSPDLSHLSGEPVRPSQGASKENPEQDKKGDQPLRYKLAVSY